MPGFHYYVAVIRESYYRCCSAVVLPESVTPFLLPFREQTIDGIGWKPLSQKMNVKQKLLQVLLFIVISKWNIHL